MRANDKNLIITPYAEYNHLDSSQIKIKEPNHLFDVDPNNRRSNKRVYIDKDAATTNDSPGESSGQTTKSDDGLLLDKKISPTIEQLIEEKEKTRGVKRPKLFDYNDEW
jgi:hypothetical protein